MDNNSSQTPRIIALVAVVLVGAVALAYAFMGKRTAAPADTAAATSSSATSDTTTTGSATAGTPIATPAGASTSVYKDGTYSATGSYISPGGDEKIGVTVTLKNDIITAASVTPAPVSSEGMRFQTIFQQNFQPLVVGKNIADVKLTKVSGSSLTPAGFDQALAMIETQAKS